MYAADLSWDHRSRHTGSELSATESTSAILRAQAAGFDPRAVVRRLEREKITSRARADAKSAELKNDGNAAFMKGDLKTAYVLYTACMHLSIRETLYPLNRAAVALKLKLYDKALEDANSVVEEEEYNMRSLDLQTKLWIVENASEITAKAKLHRIKGHFRRGQAWRSRGEWDKAGEDYGKALELKPGDCTILREMEQLEGLRGLSAEEQAAWVAEQGKVMLLDVFDPEDLKKRVEELIGRSLMYVY
ncbi:hypothetical protein DFH06DRAFT_1160507 [Mycena polygramma]|nr:hypothetical protein DFH06DRAFT_1160507 [Mycena polygramma]